MSFTDLYIAAKANGLSGDGTIQEKLGDLRELRADMLRKGVDVLSFTEFAKQLPQEATPSRTWTVVKDAALGGAVGIGAGMLLGGVIGTDMMLPLTAKMGLTGALGGTMYGFGEDLGNDKKVKQLAQYEAYLNQAQHSPIGHAQQVEPGTLPTPGLSPLAMGRMAMREGHGFT